MATKNPAQQHPVPILALVAGAIAHSTAPAIAQPDRDPADPPPPLAVEAEDEARRLLGGLTPDGVEVTGTWFGEYTAVVDGGADEDAGFRDLLTIDATLDLETIAGLGRTVAFVQLLHADPGLAGETRDAGDIQVFSNIEIDRSLTAVYEVWIEHTIEALDLRVKAGKVDANSEFALVDMLAGFANSSAGFSPTIFALPTYPDPAFSVNLFWEPTERITLAYGLYDGALAADGVRTGGRGPSTFIGDDRSNDWFHIAQAGYRWDAHGGGEVSVGGWHHTGRFARFDGGEEGSASGLYATARQTLWRDEASGRELGAAAQYGWSDPEISDFEHHLALGCVLTGTLPSRTDDELGIYISWVDLSDEPGAGFDGNETAFDLYYALSLHPNATLRPEIQYIADPSGDASIPDAMVLGCRLELSF